MPFFPNRLSAREIFPVSAERQNLCENHEKEQRLFFCVKSAFSAVSRYKLTPLISRYYPEVTPNRKFYMPTVSKVIGSHVSPTGNHFAQVSGDSCVGGDEISRFPGFQT